MNKSTEKTCVRITVIPFCRSAEWLHVPSDCCLAYDIHRLLFIVSVENKISMRNLQDKVNLIKKVSASLYLVSQMKEDEMDGECSTYGGQKQCVQGFGGET